MGRPRVLVVEDRASVLKLLATVLEREYDIITAADGVAALSALGSTPVDVVLTDVRMAGVSGFDVLRATRARDVSAEVVVMTAYANVVDAVAAIKLGAYDYISKPIDADEILLVVARAVEHRRQRSRAGGEATVVAMPELPAPDADGASLLGFHRTVEAARARASHAYLENLMRQFRGNVTMAAQQAGLTRESLHRVLKKYCVRSDAYKE